jgi:transposase
MLAFELGSTKWTLGFTTALAQWPRVRTITAGDLSTLEREIQLAKVQFALPREAPVRSCYEAGRDGFWLTGVNHAGHGERGGGLLEHRSQSAGVE